MRRSYTFKHMTLPAEKVMMTLEEFLAWEDVQEEKHEFYDGEVFAMTGATFGHGHLALNTTVALRQLVKQRGCQVSMETLKVLVDQRSFYPDIVVMCSDLVDRSDRIIKAPTLLVEVLSESTADYDKGKKWDNYQQIPSLQAYVMIAQDHISVECYERNGTEWRYNHWLHRSDTLFVSSLDLHIPLEVIYEGIDVPEFYLDPGGI